MTFLPSLQAVTYPPSSLPNLWRCRIVGSINIDEGQSITFAMRCLNWIPGQAQVVWKLSGTKAGDAHWVHKWDELIQRAFIGRGMTYQKLLGSAYFATIAGRIDITEDYDGTEIVFTNTVYLNQKTDINTADGSPGISQVTIQMQTESGYVGTLVGNGAPFFVKDVSRTPSGTPTFKLVALASDGISPLGNPTEGSNLFIKIETENTVPGTVVLVYAANAGGAQFTRQFRHALKDAAIAAGCTCAVDYATVGPYNGGIITFTNEYSDANPIVVPLTVVADRKTEGNQQVDWIAQIKQKGDPDRDLVIYSSVITKFILDTSVDPTPTYWRVLATTDGSTIEYFLFSPDGTTDSSVKLNSYGTKPAGFDAALQAAVNATAGVTKSGDVVTVTPEWLGFLTWSVPHAGSGKHHLRLTNLTGVGAAIAVEDAVVYLTPPTIPSYPAMAKGVNLSGGEFGEHNMPGNYNTDYRYPSRPEQADPAKRHQEMDYHFGKGASIFRFPVRWERVQDGLFGPLREPAFDGNWTGQGNVALDMHRIDELIAYATGLGKIVILDIHNYMGYTGGVGKVGFLNEALPTSALSDLWEKLANRYAHNSLVWFCLMNEPTGLQAAQCREIMDSVVCAIRGRTNSLNRILIAGTAYTGAWSWISSGNGEAFATFVDPAKNTIIDVHQYFDNDSSGTKSTCDVDAQTRVNGATVWARTNGQKLFLGEFMGGDPSVPGQQTCGSVIANLLTYLNTNTDVWEGWTAWGGGARWTGNYFFRLDPFDYENPIDQPTFNMIEPFMP